MINAAEKEVLIEMMANVDDIKGVLSEDQRSRLGNVFRRIGCNFTSLLEGIPEKEV